MHALSCSAVKYRVARVHTMISARKVEEACSLQCSCRVYVRLDLVLDSKMAFKLCGGKRRDSMDRERSARLPD